MHRFPLIRSTNGLTLCDQLRSRRTFNHVARAMFALLCFFTMRIMWAQKLPDAAAAINAAADREWETLQQAGRRKSVSIRESDPAAFGRLKADLVDGYVRAADRFHDFSIKHPTDPRVSEAKCQEAQALLDAWMAGDDSSDRTERRETLVRQIREDRSLPLAQRLAIAGSAENYAVLRRKDLSRGERLAGFEAAARRLADEFSESPAVYFSLLRIAEDSDAPRAQQIAYDLVNQPSAPPKARAEAQTLLDRYALIGRSLSEIADGALGKENAIGGAAGKPIVLYSWSASHPGSIALAKDLAKLAPDRLVIVGICLDQADVAVAEEVARSSGLPGRQLFCQPPPPMDPDAPAFKDPVIALAERLRLSRPALAYRADRSGAIISVSVQNNLVGEIQTTSAND